MTREISESDWKVLRALKPAALDRFCEKVLAEVGRVIADPGKSHHERYRDVYQLIHRRDEELAASFDGFSRSSALRQLALMHSHGLLKEDELSRFSPEVRAILEHLIGR